MDFNREENTHTHSHKRKSTETIEKDLRFIYLFIHCTIVVYSFEIIIGGIE